MLADQESVEDIYNRYSCHAEAETSDLHVDEENLIFFGKERGKTVELDDNDMLYERHVIDKSKLYLKTLPQSLSERGGRIFVETKEGTLPLLGMRPGTSVSEIKKTLEIMTGIPMSHQLLSSVGRVMHDEFFIEDFDGQHAIYQDSTLDLCKSGDTNAEQAHRRMAVQISIQEANDFTLIVQGRDTVHSVMQVIEAQTGYAQWQQRLTFSGKALHEKKTLADYFIYPECTLHVNIFKNPSKLFPRTATCDSQDLSGQSVDAENKPPARKIKMVRTLRGRVKGTLTIPVLTTDTLYDVKRKIKRSLQPLVDRNCSIQSPTKEQTHIDVTPRSSPATSARGNVNVCPSVKSPSPSTDSIKFCAGNLSSSAQSMTNNYGNSTSLNSPSRNVRSPLSTASSSPGQHSSPSVSVLPRRKLPSPSSLPPNFGSIRRHLEEPSLGNGSKSQSARRLQFQSGAQPLSCPNSAGVQNVGDSMGNLNEEMQDKKTLSSWINNGLQTLKGQIHAQFVDN